MEKTYYPLNEEQARIAHELNHFGAYRSDVPDYQADVDEAWRLADEIAAQKPERAEELHALANRYAKKLAEWYNAKYRIDAMCPSVLISGPANFPARKKGKQNRAWDDLYAELPRIEAIKGRMRSIGCAAEIIKSADEDAVDKLRAKAQDLRERHEAMKAANAAARKEGEQAPYPAYHIANSNQRIRATEARLKRLEAQKAVGTSERDAELLGEPVKVVENTELMRLQLVFDGKPSDDVRAALKGRGFRWSPKNGAWQRQLTDNARYALRQLLDDAA